MNASLDKTEVSLVSNHATPRQQFASEKCKMASVVFLNKMNIEYDINFTCLGCYMLWDCDLLLMGKLLPTFSINGSLKVKPGARKQFWIYGSPTMSEKTAL